ncbi:MAG: hypothetical protein ACM3U2_06900 [Deltaproteobacteria bacterium]
MKRLVYSALLLGLPAVGAIVASRGLADPPPAERRSDAEKLTALLKERRDTLKQIVDEAERDRRDGMVSAAVVSRATIDWLNAELDLAADHAARVAVHERIVAHLRKIEAALENAANTTKPAQTRARAHSESYEFLSVKAARCQAEIALLRERAKSD